MKHYIIILALIMGVFANAQDKKDFNRRTHAAIRSVETYQKRHTEKSLEQTFADVKFSRLELSVKLEEEQKIKLKDIYVRQWTELNSANANFASSGTAQNKANLISTLLKIEEETRGILTEEQLTTYKAFNKNSTDSFEFSYYKMYFFPEAEYQEYKKLVQ